VDRHCLRGLLQQGEHVLGTLGPVLGGEGKRSVDSVQEGHRITLAADLDGRSKRVGQATERRLLALTCIDELAANGTVSDDADRVEVGEWPLGAAMHLLYRRVMA
jgi:hypothetical protein